MWRFLPNFSKFLKKSSAIANMQMRTLLSDTFRLDNAWNNRLQSPILKKVNINDMFYELDNQFQHFAFANALDIDIFVNAVNDESNFDEIEDLVHKLRLSPEASNILPSTHHSLIRLYLKFNKSSDLIRILDDRLNYGIFADDYCALLLMDTFIKDGNFRDAAKVSTFCMLQEDFSNPLIKYMSLFSCHKYLENPLPWNDEDSVPQDEDDEEIKVRVRYIRNPFFDDHFDLVNPNHLIGKTLHFIGSEIDDHIGYTYKLLGLILHEKFDHAKTYLDLLRKEKKAIVKDGLKLADPILNDQSKEKADIQCTLNEIKNMIEAQAAVVKGDLLTLVEDRLKETITKNENVETNKQIKVYEEWEKTREKLLNEHIAKIAREKQLAEVQRQKQFLEAKEEELFFFENEDKLDLIIEEKDKRKEEQQERERKIKEAKLPKKKEEVIKRKQPFNPPLKEFIDENIPMKLIKTKL